ncbi:MAG: GDYXXLXY domain-containing protein [Cyanobacteria bacterium J06636_16]
MATIDSKTNADIKRRSVWAIALPLLLQTWLIAAVPLQSAIARVMGTTVILQTVPVDPFDPFRGYYVRLRYDISQRGVLKNLNGWNTLEADLPSSGSTALLEPGNTFFVVLEAPASNGTATAPEPWQPIAVSQQRPRNLLDNQLALKGTYRSNQIVYGLERYYLPEIDRLDLEQRIREAQTPESSPRLQVEVSIGFLGKAVPIALWVDNQRFEF